ncbi:Thioredoxin reductase [Litoreibacter ascidiaceicola]|uniref:Thioredoxin reductase n=1 Tax=Litoreibacter ascidiaceicola TaxID=1486859 RepID=A0A1M4V3G4_9RHOB|nr:FAD-dependent oxidoreductase [Litoreibacter ascidiaceicola]SHE63531.1 Thioredoxin reductase [Litoreibacter ascidiaceicola]
MSDVDVAIIGGGPAGLAAASALKSAGVERVVVLEREAEAGGIPRHCGHPPFGLREFNRIMTGPTYAERLVASAQTAGVEIRTLTTVVEARAQGKLRLATPTGVTELNAKRVILATGVRETPRSARLVSGARVSGVLNTGALQSMVYLKNRRPFQRPVIFGSELVAFSAILTCRHARIRPIAMIEANKHVTARWPCALFPRLAGVALHTGTRLVEILGDTKVEGVVVEDAKGQISRLECDGVILSGQFTPEAALARSGHLLVDPATGGPQVDQWGRLSDPTYFATGNVLRPVETAGWSWSEGGRTGQWVARDLAGLLPESEPSVRVSVNDHRLRFAMPQNIVLSQDVGGMRDIQLRVAQHVDGDLIAECDGKKIWGRKLRAGPEQRVLVQTHEIAAACAGRDVALRISEPAD